MFFGSLRLEVVVESGLVLTTLVGLGVLAVLWIIVVMFVERSDDCFIIVFVNFLSRDGVYLLRRPSVSKSVPDLLVASKHLGILG